MEKLFYPDSPFELGLRSPRLSPSERARRACQMTSQSLLEHNGIRYAKNEANAIVAKYRPEEGADYIVIYHNCNKTVGDYDGDDHEYNLSSETPAISVSQRISPDMINHCQKLLLAIHNFYK